MHVNYPGNLREWVVILGLERLWLVWTGWLGLLFTLSLLFRFTLVVGYNFSILLINAHALINNFSVVHMYLVHYCNFWVIVKSLINTTYSLYYMKWSLSIKNLFLVKNSDDKSYVQHGIIFSKLNFDLS